MTQKNAVFILLIFLTSVVAIQRSFAQRIHGGYYTEERVTALRNNCEKFEWAREMKEAVIEKAAPWLSIADETLWAMVPGQDLPRCIDVTFDRLTTGPKSLGCLKCGDEIKKFGNYPYDPDFRQMPWKLTCPSCNAVFPTNDFGKFYLSAIDEQGLFDPEKGDRNLLYNENHPDPSDPLHKYGVDDGFGYVDENGRSHRFIGYYTWKYWGFLYDGLEVLADAFLYTGEKQYAHKAAILLDRIADVYPDMDWKPYADLGWFHSDGGTHLGKIEGSIWETIVVQKFAESYDKILSGTLDSPKLYSFLQKQAEKHRLPSPKGTRELFIQNVDERILHTAFDAVLANQIRGNQGMHQLTVAMCAIALNTEPWTSTWLDWLFLPDGGAIPGLMASQLDRDGTSDEGAPSYSLMWGRLITELATWLADYPSYSNNSLFEDYPQFQATFLAAYRMAALGKAIPNIGDSGATGLVSNSLVDPAFMALGYRYTRDPDIAIAAYRANGNSSEGLGKDIFSEDPESLSREIEEIAKKAGPRPTGGYLMSGFGMALLETGPQPNGTALVGNYGRTIKHGHPDMLNFDLFAFGHWLTPDHGYPEFATKWASNAEWTGSTLSHNTVLVDQRPQIGVWSGRTKLFKQLDGLGVFELDGKQAYPELEQYQRTMFLVGGADALPHDQAYVVDIFHVVGGEDHLMSFHGPPGILTWSGLNPSAPESGTYAGENIPQGTWATDFPIGYSHLYGARRDPNPPSKFVVDWEVETGYRGLKEPNGIHLRLHSLSQLHEVALANGDPPQNKPGNPKTLRYVLMHRNGRELNSSFISIIEPYQHLPFIQSVNRIDTGDGGAIALKVDHVNGRTDYVVYNPTPETPVHLSNGIVLSGAMGYIQENENSVERAVLIDGTLLKYRDINLQSTGKIRGHIIDRNAELTGGGWIIVDQDLPTDDRLIGHQLVVETDGDRDASYTIRSVEKTAQGSKILCGPVSFVQGYRGGTQMVRGARVPVSYAEGYSYDFEKSAPFHISIHQEWTPSHPEKSESNTAFTQSNHEL